MLRTRFNSGTFWFRRRVPVRYQPYHATKVIDINLGTDSRAEAEKLANEAWDRLVEGWELKIAGRSDDAIAQFEAVRKLARSYKFKYVPMQDLAKAPIGDLLARVEAVPETATGEVDQDVAAALLGGVEQPDMTITDALELYWRLTKPDQRGKSPDQYRRWQNPKKKAVNNWKKVCGDSVVTEIDEDDLLDFQEWWSERVASGGVDASTANKDFSHLSAILKEVFRKKRLGRAPAIGDFKLKTGKQKRRPAFSAEWVRTRIIPELTSEACELNDQARDIALVLVNTGCRMSEVANLTATRIVLSGVPHISIAPEGRELKTFASERKIPLVGVSLEAMMRHPEGFPRYRDKPGLSATLNKYLRSRDLFPTGKHSMYSLRHTFEDSMLKAGFDERVRRDLMGHSLDGRQKYGEGLSLEEMRDLLLSIAM